MTEKKQKDTIVSGKYFEPVVVVYDVHARQVLCSSNENIENTTYEETW